MNDMTIFEKIEKHQEDKNYVKIKRDVGNKSYILSHGYILDHSFDFVFLKVNDDFLFNGFTIFQYLLLPRSDTITMINFSIQ
ncbi:hypothetical protein SAMN04488511_11588 [Pedobacter suwonensis]|uniref:Uncharacterized protein n=1 Tax=Pedobacter suwonensis TaxID=332999 RepID=A0A1I0TW43_9SPHI|nr:hypothetical protein SAMN04488511_11588 [Pedobacter suwonensis]